MLTDCRTVKCSRKRITIQHSTGPSELQTILEITLGAADRLVTDSISESLSASRFASLLTKGK